MRALFLLALLAGCGAEYDLGYPGNMGATPGGAQDIGYARDIIANGGVPTADSIPVEGLLSEHDLPTVGAPCEDLLCVRPALGVATSLSLGAEAHWVQIGMTSGVGVPYDRPPLDLVVVIDRSSSMEIDQTEVNEAVSRLVGQLGPDDRLAVVAFNQDVDLLHPLARVTEPDALIRDVKALDARGGWAIQAAMEQAYALHDAGSGDPGRLRRVALMTCGYPSISEDYSDPFSQLVRDGADDRIGTSVFGVILGYDPTLANLLGETRGGSFSYLESLEKVEQVFDDDFDTMMSPLAYDLSLTLDLDDRFEIDRIYGIPGDADGAPRTELDVATAFASNRRGAIVARLLPVQAPAEEQEVATVSLSYTPESAHGFTGPVTQQAPVVQPAGSLGGGGGWYQGVGVRKAVALVNQAEQMQAACGDFHEGRADDAITTLEALHAYLVDEAAELEDAGLATEAALVAQLLENVRAG